MNDSDSSRRKGSQPPRERGPANSEFLELEISRVLESEAERLTREAGRELLKEAIRRRLQERMGDRIEAIAHRAADIAVDDFEANLRIEAILNERREQRREGPAGTPSDAAPRSTRNKAAKKRKR